ncbi:MAG: BamA/TamA family outer membrane protein [Gemmatimonadaceae bacterium]
MDRWSAMVLAVLVCTVPVRAQETGAAQGREVVRITDAAGLPGALVDDVLRVVNDPGTLRSFGNLNIEATRQVNGDVAVLGGNVSIAGHVRGRVIAVNGDVLLHQGARIDGNLLVIGGRLVGRDVATVGGDVQEFADRIVYTRTVDSTAVSAPAETNPDERWWRLRQRWRKRSWSDIRLVSAHTYNRVEGLPVLVGPAFGRDLGWSRLTLDILGVARSVGSFEQTSENLGHSVKMELRFGRDYGVRVGGQLQDLVSPVEGWQMSEGEIGLASFFLRKDFADYYNEHGGKLYGGLYLGDHTDLTVSYADERWGSRRAKNPLSLLHNNSPWRVNPAMDDGTFHLLQAAVRYDSRNDPTDPWTGWFLSGKYEFGRGAISQYGATSIGVRQTNLNGQTEYDQFLLDVRRYNRVSPEGQLNLRVVLGGWLSGDDLPLQRRYSVGGPGTLPGYDFRRVRGDTDFWQCSELSSGVAGQPAQCSRIALGQIEYRAELGIDPWGMLGGERAQRRLGWGRRPEWVAFADAGRGWLVGDRRGDMVYPANRLPPLGTFRADLGVGIKLDDLGLYLAKGVSEHGGPWNFFVRVKPRF